MTKKEENEKIDENLKYRYSKNVIESIKPYVDFLKTLSREKLISEVLMYKDMAHDSMLSLMKVRRNYEKEQQKRKQQ